MPIFETCKGVCDQTINIDANNKGHSNTVVQEPTNLHVVGYYVVFNDVGGSMSSSSYGSCGSIVGDYSLTCASNDVRPGVNGKAPYLYHGRKLTVNLTLDNDPFFLQFDFVSLWVFPLSDLRSIFDGNVAATYGGAIYIGKSVSNVFVMPGTVFTDNTAKDSGGAIFLDSLINKLYFYSTTFSGNSASTNGGAVAFQNLMTSIHFHSCSLTANRAEYGGALYFGTANGNDLSNTGLVNVNEFVNLTMRHNNAALDGGGIYANNLNVFSIASSRMVDNVAGRSRGAIAMNTANAISISTLISFVHNNAGADGGAIFSNASNTITCLVGSTITFSRNTCMGRGGALAMNAGSIVTFNGTTIYDSNFAQNQGGAIAVSASSLVLGSSAITFINNSALSGSAMYLMSSSTSSVDLMIPLGGGCTTPTICTTPPGSLSTGYITRAFYGRSDATMPPPGCNNAPYDLWVHELGVYTKSYKNYIHGSGYGVYSLIPSTTGGFPQLIFEQYGTTTTGMHTYNNQSLLEYPRFVSNTFFSFSSIFFCRSSKRQPLCSRKLSRIYYLGGDHYMYNRSKL